VFFLAVAYGGWRLALWGRRLCVVKFQGCGWEVGRGNSDSFAGVSGFQERVCNAILKGFDELLGSEMIFHDDRDHVYLPALILELILRLLIWFLVL
jgi:hypothetical protein